MASRGWKSLIVPGLFVLAALAVLIALGNWQMRRLAWKDGIIATIESRVDMVPISLDEALARWNDSHDVEYVPVTVTGSFLNEAERYLVATEQGDPGWHVYTPLEIDTGRIVFVNRGFVPAALRDPATRPQGLIDGVVTFEALARNAPSEKPNVFLPNHDLSKNVFLWRDISNMAAEAGYKGDARLVPFFLDARAGPDPAVWPRGGVTRVVIENKHFGYAMTWYGIALTLAGVFAVFAWSRLRPPAAET